jgi:hypothetical protein
MGIVGLLVLALTYPKVFCGLMLLLVVAYYFVFVRRAGGEWEQLDAKSEDERKAKARTKVLGIATVAPTYLSTLNAVLKYFIIGFLLVRFNPWVNNYEMTPFDRTIVFSAAFFLLASTAITSLVLNALHLPNAH